MRNSVHTFLRIVAFCLVAGLAVSCARKPETADPNTYAGEIDQWHAQRLADLTSESGWLSLVGLYWLKDGPNTFGSEATNDIVVPQLADVLIAKAAAHAGTFVLTNGVVTFETPLASAFAVDGMPLNSLVEERESGKGNSSVSLRSDAAGKPTVVQIGSITIQIIKRGDRLGVRVKDKENPDRLKFRGLEYFPTSLKWRINARFEPYNPPQAVPILNVLNMESDEPSPGAIVFEVDGKTYRLDAITEKDEPRLFMIFADDTRGKETYGAGRYLYVDPPDKNNRVVIDFNKAYSPPCAFTNFATCPLPPKQNILPIRIDAGEKYTDHLH